MKTSRAKTKVSVERSGADEVKITISKTFTATLSDEATATHFINTKKDHKKMAEALLYLSVSMRNKATAISFK